MEIPKIGRPKKFKTPQDLEKLINKFFESCYEKIIDENLKVTYKNIKPLTMRGLCVYLGIAYESLMRYSKNYGEEYSEPIKNAKQICQTFLEEELYNPKRPTAGVIFGLKNCYSNDWKDKIETENKNINIDSIKFEFGEEEE